MADTVTNYISLDSIIKDWQIDAMEVNNASYNRAFAHASRAVSILNWDVLKKFKAKILPVDTSTKTVMIPTDCTQYVYIGFINQVGEKIPLTFDPNLTYGVETPDCHCPECGCTDEACYSITNSTAETSEVTVQNYVQNDAGTCVLESQTFTRTIKTCVEANGNIVKQITEPVRINNETTWDYSINIAAVVVHTWTSAYFVINGVHENLDLSQLNSEGLHDYLVSIGWTSVSATVLTLTETTQAITSLVLVNGGTQTVIVTPTGHSCPWDYELQTRMEFVCAAEIKECGCVVLTNEIINTLVNANLITNNMFQRWINGGDISNVYRQPLNLYGFYNVFPEKGIIQLDPFFQYDCIYLEYYTTDEIDSKNFLVPVLARDYIIAYVHMMSMLRKPNANPTIIEMAKKQCRAEKHNLKLRWTPPRADQYKDLTDTPASRS